VDDDRTVEEIRQRIDALERTASLGYLLSAIVHEVNNPLSVMLIGADTLRRRAGGSEAVTHHLDVLEQQSDKIMDINRRLQELSRWNMGESRDVDAGQLVRSFAELEVWIEGDARRPSLRLPDEPITISVEPERTMLVLRFLARYARSQGGGDAVEVSLMQENIPLIEMPTRHKAPTRDFAVFRLTVGTPAAQAVPFTEWVGDFFGRDADRQVLELMACWEVVRKMAGRLRLRSDDHGAEAQLMIPLERPKMGGAR